MLRIVILTVMMRWDHRENDNVDICEKGENDKVCQTRVIGEQCEASVEVKSSSAPVDKYEEEETSRESCYLCPRVSLQH